MLAAIVSYSFCIYNHSDIILILKMLVDFVFDNKKSSEGIIYYWKPQKYIITLVWHFRDIKNASCLWFDNSKYLYSIFDYKKYRTTFFSLIWHFGDNQPSVLTIQTLHTAFLTIQRHLEAFWHQFDTWRY